MTYNLLKGKKGIITGALDENSIAWKTALKVKEEGADFVLTNAPLAMKMGKINKLAELCNTIVIEADATSLEDIESLYNQTQEKLGGKIDFMLHSIGMSPNVRKNRHYGNLNYDWFHKSLDVSGLSFHKLIQVAEKMDAINEWGSIVGLTYIAGQRSFSHYSDMAQAKAVLESIARSYGDRYGRLKKVRINTISQSPTATTAGKGVKDFDAFITYSESMSPLGNATAEDCANYIITLFSDFTKKVTMQNLFHDGGFSATGISADVVKAMKKNL